MTVNALRGLGQKVLGLSVAIHVSQASIVAGMPPMRNALMAELMKTYRRKKKNRIPKKRPGVYGILKLVVRRS